jgi:hypothetical protein
MAISLGVLKDLRQVHFGPVRFHFYEITRVTPQPGGGASVKFGPLVRELKVPDWTKLTNSGYDFKVLGIELRSNAPVANIQSLPSP